MALPEREKQDVWLHEPEPDSGRFMQTGVAIRAVLLPVRMWQEKNVQVHAQVYGERETRHVTCFYEGEVELRVGQGISPRKEGAVHAPCEYRVVSVAKWPTHWQATLEWIAEGRRGM